MPGLELGKGLDIQLGRFYEPKEHPVCGKHINDIHVCVPGTVSVRLLKNVEYLEGYHVEAQKDDRGRTVANPIFYNDSGEEVEVMCSATSWGNGSDEHPCKMKATYVIEFRPGIY